MEDKLKELERRLAEINDLEPATGGPLRIEPYMTYLRGKYGDLYGLSRGGRVS